jgi:putative ABC transport system substrate-binding protein
VRTGSPPPAEQEAFRQGLRDVGDLAGQPVTLEDRHAGGHPAHLPALVAALVRLPVAELLTIGPAALQAAPQATATIPLVAHDLESDPVQRGYVVPLAQPGGTITGGFLDMSELVGKWLELRKEVRPQLARVTVLWDPATGAVQRDAAHAAAHRVGIALPTLAGRTEVECAPAFTAIPQAPPDAVRILGSPLMRRNSKRMADVATHSRLPALSPCRDFPEVGGLMAYGPSMPAMFRRCGVQVDQMRQGVQPGDVPMERPQKFDLVRHLQTAQALGVPFPPTLLVLADAVCTPISAERNSATIWDETAQFLPRKSDDLRRQG